MSVGLAQFKFFGRASPIVVGPMIAPVIDLIAASDTGASSTDNITSNTTPSINVDFDGTLLEGDTVSFYDGGALLSTHVVTAGEAGAGDIDLGLSALSAGSHAITCTHARGSSTSPVSNTLTITIIVAPTISSLIPADGATGISLSSNMLATFNEDVVFASSVNIGVYKTSDDTLVQGWNETQIGAGISVGGAVLTINPTSDLTASTGYYVKISGIVGVTTGAAFSIADKTTWNFTTAAAASTFSLVQTDYGSESLQNPVVTYTGKSLGVAHANRYIVVSCFSRFTSAGPGSPVAIACTVDGVAATLVKRANQEGAGVEIWIANLTANSNTTGNVVINYTGATSGAQRTGMKVHRLITTTPVATGTQQALSASGNSLTTVGTLTIPSGGGAIAIYGAQSPVVSADITWTGVTLDPNSQLLIQTFSSMGTGVSTTAGATSITASIAGSPNNIVCLGAAAWGP